MWTSKSSLSEFKEVTDRSSSSPGKLDPLRLLESQEVEKMEPPPKAFESPAAGILSEPDRRRLLRSVTADVAADDATDVVCRSAGLAGVIPRPALTAIDCCGCCWGCC